MCALGATRMACVQLYEEDFCSSCYFLQKLSSLLPPLLSPLPDQAIRAFMGKGCWEKTNKKRQRIKEGGERWRGSKMRMGKVTTLGGMLSRAPLALPTHTELAMPEPCAAAAQRLVQHKGMAITSLGLQMAKGGNRTRPLRVNAPDFTSSD